MALIWGGNSQSAWDLGNQKNWVINKSPEQNFNELVTGMQIIGLTIPSATWGAYPGVAVKAVSGAGAAAAVSGAGTAGVGTAAAGLGTAAAAGLKAAEKGLDLAILTQVVAWLTKYWWIPTIFIGLWTVGKFGGK